MGPGTVLRENDGATQSFREIFGFGEEQARHLVTTASFALVGAPGASTYLYAPLRRPRARASTQPRASFLSVATDVATIETLGEDTAPHRPRHGAELTVTG